MMVWVGVAEQVRRQVALMVQVVVGDGEEVNVGVHGGRDDLYGVGRSMVGWMKPPLGMDNAEALS